LLKLIFLSKNVDYSKRREIKVSYYSNGDEHTPKSLIITSYTINFVIRMEVKHLSGFTNTMNMSFIYILYYICIYNSFTL